jgi:hypothetical protein
MGRILRALVATLLIIEIAAIFLGTSTWALLAEMHASSSVILGGEALAGLAIVALAVVIFRRALAAERRIDENRPSGA